MKKKGQITYFIVYLIIAILIVSTATVIKPIGETATTTLFSAGQTILLEARNRADYISNTTVKNEIKTEITSAIAKKTSNEDLAQNFFKYSWIVILILSALIIFVFSKYYSSNQQGGLIG